MTGAVYRFVGRIFRSLWVAGPIFDKELRVSSRRRRNYVLRFVYLGLLVIFLSLVWLGFVHSGSSGLYTASRMAEAGKFIIAYIIWFQFCAAQVVAVIMLSTSISDEIYNRTLGTLMTTPINSFQIVMGKLFSKLLQLILLLAISLPLLAMVRVFGGVPWGYVISSLCITLTTILFVGSLSLFFSIFNKRAYTAIITTFVLIVVLFALAPYLAAFGCKAITGHWPNQKMTGIIFCPNPYFAMFVKTISMLEPRSVGNLPSSLWYLHCVIVLGASAIVLFVSVIFVRKVALRQATGQTIVSSGRRSSKKIAAQLQSTGRTKIARIRRVKGPPVAWKELCAPLVGKHKLLTYLTVFFAFVLLVVSYGLFAGEGMLDDRETHIIYAVIFLGLGLLLSVVVPATSISSEKEARSWPLLLSTTLSNWQIILGKFLGVLRRCLLGWVLLLGHIVFFSITGFIHPVGLLQITILIISVSIFLACSGLYFSSLFKRTTSAVIMNLLLAASLWIILPLFANIAAQISRFGRDTAGTYADANPFIQAVCIMDATAHGGSLSKYDWIGLKSGDSALATVWILLCMLAYSFVGFCFLWRAKCRIRRGIF